MCVESPDNQAEIDGAGQDTDNGKNRNKAVNHDKAPSQNIDEISLNVMCNDAVNGFCVPASADMGVVCSLNTRQAMENVLDFFKKFHFYIKIIGLNSR